MYGLSLQAYQNLAIPLSPNRCAQGIGKSPYSPYASGRYALNFISNGYFSYKNPDTPMMHLLGQSGAITIDHAKNLQSSIKILFLGDFMTSKTGIFPLVNTSLIELLKSADIIIVNVESPVVVSNKTCKRGCLSLRFQMDINYLKNLCNYNRQAQWIINVANNHTFDTSDKDSNDISGLLTTIEVIKKDLPGTKIIGTSVNQNAQSLLVLEYAPGFKIGIIGWTDLMNNDHMHYKKPIVRGQDLNSALIKALKQQAGLDLFIGFAHGNEEQSYEPLQATRNHWKSMTGSELFDIIVGTGPHVVQPAETINNRLLFHSIGDFFSPSGRSQTKVGCIVELTVEPREQSAVNMHYNMHVLQQNQKCITLFALDDITAWYPEIIERFKTIWPSLI